jgi:flagellin-like protein
MRCHELLTDDDAVSPVIGVVLMVAITVILAAVVGVFVLGLNETQQPPSVAFAPEENPDAGYVNFTHDGGDLMRKSELSVGGDVPTDSVTYSSSRLQAGDSVDAELNASKASTGDTVSLVWNSPKSDETQLLAEITLSKEGWDTI